MPFDISKVDDFLTPLGFLVVLISGFSVGYLVLSLLREKISDLFYMMTTIGVMFFWPLVIERAFDGIPDYEQELGTWLTFELFVVAIVVGVAVRRRRG